jgi:hypothetical protein
VHLVLDRFIYVTDIFLAGEGADYTSYVLQFIDLGLILQLLALIGLGVLGVVFFPRKPAAPGKAALVRGLAALLAVLGISQAGSFYGELAGDNVWDNFQYTMGSQMASNPILYLLPKVATLLEDSVGGIDLPFVNVMGFGVDLNTSVAQLMNVAAMSGSILGALGPMMSGLASAVSGSVMLNTAGINTNGKAPVIARGSAQPLQHLGGSSISESGYIGNSDGNSIKEQTLQDAADSKKKQLVEARDEESSDDVVIKSQMAVVNIYNLLEEIAHGSQSLRVRVVGGCCGSGGASGGGSGGTNNTIGDSSNVGSTGAMGSSSLVNGATGGADNGNWVLSF